MASQKELAFNQEALDHHNSYRKLHGVGMLRLSEECRKTAQDWAETLVKRNQLENCPVSCRGEVGENISSRSTTGSFCDLSGKDVSEQWYKDISKYDFNSGTGNAGNFTQLVWAGSQEVGFGKAHHNGKCVVVAHYKPPGNMRSRYKENVFPANTSPAVAAAARSSMEDPACEGTVEAPETAPEAVKEDDLAVAKLPEDSPVPKGKKTKTTVVTETVNEPNGKTYTVRREIEEYTDDFGNITERVKEIRLDEPDSGAHHSTGTTSSSEEEKDAEPEEKKELNIFARDLLDSHNAYRRKHSSPPLTRNKDLDKMAQEWAETLVRAERLTNSNYTYKGNRLGENIASRWSNGPCDSSGHEVCDHWYSEEKKFDYSTEPTNVQGIGNFTQLVWKNSKEIGVGKAIHSGSDGTKVITVCLYHPAGNVLQCFKDNVAKVH